MDFTAPAALLLLLLLIPYFVWLGRPGEGAARWRERVSLALRLAILFLLILSLAGTRLVRAAEDLAVVFLMDASDSVNQDDFKRAEEFVRQTIEELGPNDQAAVVLFGANALVDRPMSRLAELAPIRTTPESLQTDIAEAVRLGLALFPTGSARRLVILSDGAATRGNAEEAAQLAAASDVQIDVVSLGEDLEEAEALLTAATAPGKVREGERFSVEVTAVSNRNTPAELSVLAGNEVVYSETVELRPGTNSFSVPLIATTQEFARFVVQLNPALDTFYQNNQLSSFTDIIGQPRVLLVAQREHTNEAGDVIPDESTQLLLALQSAGLQIDRVNPSDLPSSLVELSNYDSIILQNVNAKDLTERKMAALEQYVRELGGGTVAVGGPDSFGMGGYFRTPLEEMLPVNMQIMDQERFPSVSMVLVIDRSGSMSMQEGGLTKIQLAAEGAARAVELLNDFDEITIIPVDTAPDNPIGPALVSNREEITSRIRQIGAGGGGIYVRTGLEAAAQALSQSSNQVKHIIILADGADSEQKEGVPELIGALTAQGVTISTVSIGSGPDVPWLQDMAELGGGRFHLTDRAANLPQIFTQETAAIQRSYLVEERFFPELGATGFASRHAIFRAMERSGITQVPPLFGYVGTSPKQTSQVVLESHLGDPLLAAWEYGLGRAAAWTSDATGRWGRSWVTWEGFPAFWSNLVRWSISEGRDSTFQAEVLLDGDEALLTVDARDESGRYLNELDVSAVVIPPLGESTQLTLNQSAPGRYRAYFSPKNEGAYLIRVSGSTPGGESLIGQTIGWALNYSPEYRQSEPDHLLLERLAAITGGRVLSLDPEDGEAAAVLEHSIAGQAAARPIWPWLLVAAVILLPFDIAVRRLVLTRRDLQQAWSATYGRIRPTKQVLLEQPQQVTQLIRAKERAQVHRPELPGDSYARETTDAPGQESPQMPPTPAAPVSRVEEPSEEEAKTLASRLLERRRQRGDGEGEVK